MTGLEMPVFPPTVPMVWSRPWAGITDIAAVFPGLAHGSRCSSRFCTVSLVLFFSLAVFLPSVGLTRNVRFWFGRTCGGHACSDPWSFFTFSFLFTLAVFLLSVDLARDCRFWVSLT